MPARIKLSQLNHNISTNSDYIVGQSFAPDIFVCLPDLHHQFALSSFNYQIGKNQGAKVIKNGSLGCPYVDSTVIRSLFMPSVLPSSSKYSIKIFDQISTCIINFYTRMKLISTSISSLFNSTNIEASFSVDYASQIGDLFRSMISTKNSWFSYEIPFDNDCLIINEKTEYVQPERLNEKAPVIGWCDSLTTIR